MAGINRNAWNLAFTLVIFTNRLIYGLNIASALIHRRADVILSLYYLKARRIINVNGSSLDYCKIILFHITK